MTVQINGTTGIDQIQPGVIQQSDLGSNVAGNGPCFSTRNGAAVSCNSSVSTKLTAGAIDFDTASCFAANRFTPNVAGYYQITGTSTMDSGWTSVAYSATIIFKNGVKVSQVGYTPGSNYNGTSLSVLVYLNGTTDYVELYAQQNSGSAKNMFLALFSGFLARSA